MRKAGIENPYERMKELTRGKTITPDDIRSFVETLELPEDDKTRLLELTPEKYIGIAKEMLHNIKND